MTLPIRKPLRTRTPALWFLCLAALPLAGCSEDFASVDDVHLPTSVQERYPIEVVDRPAKLNVSAERGRISPEEVNRVMRFGQQARQSARSPVAVSYPKGNAHARAAAKQAVQLLSAAGVPRGMIHVSAYEGKSATVSLSYARKVAVTRECGDWSTDIANDAQNRPHPDFGCAYQNNLAAMVANPEDLQQPRSMGPAYARGRMAGMENYNTGKWTEPPVNEQSFFDLLFN